MLKNIFKLAKASVILLLFILAGCKSGRLGMLGGENTLEEVGNNEVKDEEKALTKEVKLLIERCGNAYQAFYVALSECNYQIASELLHKIFVGKNGLDVRRSLYCQDCGNSFKAGNIYFATSTLLHLAVKAVKENDEAGLALIKRLYDLGCKDVINRRDSSGNPVLHLAIQLDKLSIVQYLVSNGADINANNSADYTALQLALTLKKHKIAIFLVEQLFEKGGDMDFALRNCAGFCDEEFAAMLVSMGADSNAKSAYGETALHIAASSDNIQVASYLMSRSGVEIDAKNKLGHTPLHIAALHGSMQVLRHLINNGADINAKSEEGKTVLYFAAYKGNIDIIKYLVSKGADINAEAKQGESLLRVAVLGLGNKEFIKKLLEEFNFDDVINEQDSLGDTLLHLAAFNADELFDLLIMQGADLSIKNNKGDMPLHNIVRKRKPTAENCQVVLEKVMAILASNRVFRLKCLATKFPRAQYLKFEGNMFKQILDYGDLNLNMKNNSGEVFAEICRKNRFEELAARIEAIVSTYIHQEEKMKNSKD